MTTFDPSGARDALDSMTQLLVGTKQLQDQPGVLYSLAIQQARPQDAQAVDQFMQGLEAEKRVTLARQTGEKLVFTPNEKMMLQENGVNYNDVEYTQQNAASDANHLIMAQTGGQYTAKMKADGSLELDQHGQIQRVKTHTQHSSGWFDSVGSFFGHIGNSIEDAGSGVLEGAQKGYNFAQGVLHSGVPTAPSLSDIADGNTDAGTRIGKAVDSNYQDMVDNGYDPTSTWSTLAFDASGKKHGDLSNLNGQYGIDKVDEAIKFLADPEKYRAEILQNDANYAKDSYGQTTLTSDAQAKLKWLGSKEFEHLARQVNAHSATVGNDVANALGIDPVSHSTTYNITAAASNIAASFAVDPTLLLLKGVKVAKFASVGLNSLQDADRAASILVKNSRLPWVNNVQRGWQTAIDLSDEMRLAHSAGDTAKLASLTAEFNAKVPGLAPLMGEFIGEHAITGGSEVIENGKKVYVPTFGQTEGIRDLPAAAKWIRSKQGLNLLMNGRAGTQASLMPGALSAFGYRQVKGLTAGWMTARSADRAIGSHAEAVGRLESAGSSAIDAWKAKGLITERDLARFEPHADDAISHDGTVLGESEAAADATATLPSAQRGRLALTAAGKGEVARNLRQTGDVLGDGRLGYFGPTATAARARLAAQRLSTLLPRNTLIDVNDAASSDKIYKMAMTYLNRGDANALRAAWNVGNPGQRKAIIGGLVDQIGHAAGLGKTATGRDILARASTAEERYAVSGDDIEINGEKMGLFEGQTRMRWTLPTFQAIQSASRKYGLWEATMGRAMTSHQADSLMSQWKMGALFKPSTITRNQLEGWLRTILEGRAGDALKARALATARNKELWARGYGQDALDTFTRERGNVEGLRSMLGDGGLSQSQRADAMDRIRESERVMSTLGDHPIIQHHLALEAGDTERAGEIANGSMLAGQQLGRSFATHRLADLAPLSSVARAYRGLTLRHMDEETVSALLTLTPAELSEAMRGYGQQILESDLGFRNAAKQSTEVASAGIGPSKLRYAKDEAIEGTTKLSEKELAKQESKQGLPGVRWTHKAVDDSLGADRYANALHQRIDAMPATARAAIAHLRDPEHDINEVVQALEKESKNTAFGKTFFEDPSGNPNSGRWAATPEEAAAGKVDWARSVVNEYSALLHGQNGEMQHELADYITEHGVAPDADWILEHVRNDARPATVLAPEVMGMANGGVKSMWNTIQDVEGAGYAWVVERALQRTTTAPVFLANYAIARKGLNAEVERLVETGVSREAAENMAKDLSIRNAWVKTEQLIDDPGQKTQFDVIARNFFPFARATNAMVRRWGTGLWQNPAAARKMMLAYEGAVHSGLIYDNVYGEPTFTYPGSGVMNMAMRELSKVPGFENVAAFPVASDMTGGVLMSVPGADNPLRMGMGPMISIPLREVYKHLLPTSWQGDALNADEFINGPIGAGETWSQLVPTAVRKFYVALSGDDRNSAMASAMNGAIANLAAAGLVPSTENGDSMVAQQFRTRLQTQVQNQLFLRAVFGLFSPAAPSAPSEGTSASGADYAWSIDGIKQLSDEYRKILNEVGGDVGRANAVFTTLHPDEVVFKNGEHELHAHATAYETTRSGSAVPGAYLPATDSALNWMTQHENFIKSYPSVAAYFLPNSSSNEPFSDAAYKAQLELGLRLRKTPQEFMNDVYLKHAESSYFPTLQEYDRRINDAKANGDKSTADYWSQSKSEWEKQYQNINPLLKAKIDDYGNARHKASAQLTDLKLMLDHGQVPEGLAPKLSQMITTYDNYEAFIKQYAGNDTANREARSNALDMVNQWAQEHLSGTPLADVFNGVFRVLNTNLVKLDGGS